jgi:putative spermidine/putrescine transport system substrate-binding protein
MTRRAPASASPGPAPVFRRSAAARALLGGLVVTVLAGLVLAACGSSTDSSDRAPVSDGSGSDFAKVEEAAQGQTVRWWMYGGDPRVNRFVDREVTPRAERLGVTLERVPIGDTADAVNRVVAERRAGKSDGGGVDLIWINGENFASGKEVGLWREDWAGGLPNSRYLDPDSSLTSTDFGVQVDGQESPWARAGFVFAYDSSEVADPPGSFPELLDYARDNPGRVAYPAPPDFTGSAFVRQVVQRFGSRAEGLDFLKELEPLSYREGEVYPKSEQELSRLFADDQIDFAMSYNSNFVELAVSRGQFPPSVRPFLIGGGALQNSSFVTIPANAGHPEGAEVVADLLLSPEVQAAMQDPEVVGLPTVLDPDRLSPAQTRLFEPGRSPYLPESLGRPLAELPADQVPVIDRAWMREVLR